MTQAATLANSVQVPQITTYTSGSGTYTTPTGCKYLTVEMIGGGGGAASAGTTSGGVAGTTGGASTFGSVITCNGGQYGGLVVGLSGGYGGTVSVTTSGSILQLVAVKGSQGQQGGSVPSGTAMYPSSAIGATSPFGGAGGANVNDAGTDAQANSGSGGGGGQQAGAASGYNGGGGGAGGYARVMFTAPSATYTYSVGAGGTGGVNAGYKSGGAGGSGVIIITAYF